MLGEGYPKAIQYTAVDEATRLRCRVIFDEHSSWNAVRFLHYVRKKFPFKIKCVQTDNGTEFTNALLNPGKLSEFEQYLNKEKIMHKRILPATPRHNGKVERVHRMDDERFYSNRSFYSVEDANKQLQPYQRWNNNFPLLVLGRKSPPPVLEGQLYPKCNRSFDNVDPRSKNDIDTYHPYGTIKKSTNEWAHTGQKTDFLRKMK